MLKHVQIMLLALEQILNIFVSYCHNLLMSLTFIIYKGITPEQNSQTLTIL